MLCHLLFYLQQPFEKGTSIIIFILGTERLINFLKVTQLANGKAGI